MNKTLATSKNRHHHPPDQPVVSRPAAHALRRVGFVDQIALHLGVALITWSRRPQHPRSSVSVAARAQHQLQRERLAEARARNEQIYPRFIIR